MSMLIARCPNAGYSRRLAPYRWYTRKHDAEVDRARPQSNREASTLCRSWIRCNYSKTFGSKPPNTIAHPACRLVNGPEIHPASGGITLLPSPVFVTAVPGMAS
eukprot:6639462-Pyramimonas_sp.AAC.1